MVLPPSTVKDINTDIVLGLVTDLHAIVVEVLLSQFLTLLKGIVSPLLQDPNASEDAIAGQEGLANSIRRLDPLLADNLKLVIDRL